MTGPLSEDRVREIVREELAAQMVERRKAGRQKWLKDFAELQQKIAEQNVQLAAEGIEVRNPISDTTLTDLAASFRRQDTQDAARLARVAAEVVDSSVQRTNFFVQAGQDTVDVFDPEFKTTEGVSESGEHCARVVGVIGGGVAGAEDLGEVGDQAFSDRCGVAAFPAGEVEGVFERQDSSLLLVGVDNRSVGERPASGPCCMGEEGPRTFQWVVSE